MRDGRRFRLLGGVSLGLWMAAWGCSTPAPVPDSRLEADNPLRPIPDAPLGAGVRLQSLAQPPTPERVRLGRWLFFDKRLSGDGHVACATCHQPEHGFSQPTPVATGINGRHGRRKVPPILNLAVESHVNFKQALQSPLFWDGRASSLERQAIEPIVNPDEMGNTAAALPQTLSQVTGYRRYFAEAFGDAQITTSRIAHALADYERTRLSGNSAYDRWKIAHDDTALTDAAKRGYTLFIGKAQCAHCHTPPLFSGGFHNTGIGWDPATQTFADQGRYIVTKGTIDEDWPGTFKTPTLREVTRRAPYMHDGSIRTLREVVAYYNRGARPNPYLSAFIRPLGLSPRDIDDLVAFLESLNGEGWQDAGPTRFPQ